MTTVQLEGVDPAVVERFALDRLPLDRPGRSTDELMNLRGRRAVVTGGGGDGLGAATCLRLAGQGADVAVMDISEEQAQLTVDAIQARFDVRCMPLIADVGEVDQVRAAANRVASEWGGIDILVNNAGGSGSIGAHGEKVNQSGDFMAMSDEDLLLVVRVNLLGVMLVSRAVLPHMLAARSGRIINVSSEGGKTSVDGIVVYNSCKSGVIGFTRNLARDVGKHGVTVAGVCPGIMVSERTIRNMTHPNAPSLASLEDSFQRVTIRRCSVPDEVASVIAFLASDAGGYVHGTSVSVGGGLAD